MIQDEKYDYALDAALVILDQIDAEPGMPKHKRLAMTTYAILHAMERYEVETPRDAVHFSVN